MNSGLSAGFPEKFVKRPAVPEHLDALLRSMLDTRQQRNNTTSTNIDPKSSLKQLPKFITWRGLITKLMCLPYSNNRDSFELNICQFKASMMLRLTSNWFWSNSASHAFRTRSILKSMICRGWKSLLAPRKRRN